MDIGRFEEQSVCVPCQDIPKGRTQDQASEVPPHLVPTPCASIPLHERPTAQAWSTKQSPQPCVLTVQGAEWPHGGSRDLAPHSREFRPHGGWGWTSKMGQMGQGHGGALEQMGAGG